MTLKKKVKKALPYSFAIAMFQLIFSLFGMVLLVRYLDTSEYGILAIFLGIPPLLNIFLSFGHNAVFTRYIPGMNDPVNIRQLVWRVIFRRLLLLLATGALLTLGYEFYADTLNISGYYQAFLYFQGYLVFYVLNLFLKLALDALFLQKYVLGLSLLRNFLFVSITAWGIFTGQSFAFFTALYSIVEVILFLAGLLTLAKATGVPAWTDILGAVPEGAEQRSYRRISFINQFGTSFLGTDIDRYILSVFSNNQQVAIYAVATQIIKKIRVFLPHSLFRPLAEPSFYGKYEESGNASDICKMFEFLFNANTIFGLMVLMIFIPLGEEMIVLLFNPDYLAAYWPIVIFLFFLIFYAIPLGMVVKALKKPEILIYSKAAIFVNLGLGIPLAARFGALGMAFATAFSTVIKNAIIFGFAVRHLDLRIPWISALKALLNATVSMASVYICKAIMVVPAALQQFAEQFAGAAVTGFLGTLLPLVLAGLAGIVIYLLLLKINPVLDVHQRRLALDLAPAKFNRLIKAVL